LRLLRLARKLEVKPRPRAAVFVLAALLFWTGAALADGSGDPAAVKNEDGKYFDKDGNPTYKVKSDGTVDWYTYSGYPTLSLRLPRLPWAGWYGLVIRTGTEVTSSLRIQVSKVRQTVRELMSNAPCMARQ